MSKNCSLPNIVKTRPEIRDKFDMSNALNSVSQELNYKFIRKVRTSDIKLTFSSENFFCILLTT